jgi:hypothetical protein
MVHELKFNSDTMFSDGNGKTPEKFVLQSRVPEC